MIYKYITIPIKVLMTLKKLIGKKNPKSQLNHKGPKVAKKNFEKENKASHVLISNYITKLR